MHEICLRLWLDADGCDYGEAIFEDVFTDLVLCPLSDPVTQTARMMATAQRYR